MEIEKELSSINTNIHELEKKLMVNHYKQSKNMWFLTLMNVINGVYTLTVGALILLLHEVITGTIFGVILFLCLVQFAWNYHEYKKNTKILENNIDATIFNEKV